MSLLQQIKDKSLLARKERDPMATFLVTLYAEAARVGKDNGNRESTDDEVLSTLRKFKEGAKTIIETSTNQDLLEQAVAETILVDTFLPIMLTEHELTAIINGYIVSTPDIDSKSMGVIMSKLKQEHLGLYDGQLAAKLVKDALHAL